MFVDVPPCSKVLALPITNCKDLTHLCNWLLACMCVYVRVPGLCVICSRTWKWSVCFFFFFFSIVFSCLATVFMLWSFPSADGNGSAQPTHPTSPLSSRITTLLFLSPASQLLSLTCILLIPQILVSPVDALCRWRWACVCVVSNPNANEEHRCSNQANIHHWSPICSCSLTFLQNALA